MEPFAPWDAPVKFFARKMEPFAPWDAPVECPLGRSGGIFRKKNGAVCPLGRSGGIFRKKNGADGREGDLALRAGRVPRGVRCEPWARPGDNKTGFVRKNCSYGYFLRVKWVFGPANEKKCPYGQF